MTIEEYDRLSQLFNSDIWGTPDSVLDLCRQVMGAIDLDPCTQAGNPTKATRFFTEADDGLSQQWTGKIYCNPPYSAPEPWVKKVVRLHLVTDVVGKLYYRR